MSLRFMLKIMWLTNIFGIAVASYIASCYISEKKFCICKQFHSFPCGHHFTICPHQTLKRKHVEHQTNWQCTKWQTIIPICARQCKMKNWCWKIFSPDFLILDQNCGILRVASLTLDRQPRKFVFLQYFSDDGCVKQPCGHFDPLVNVSQPTRHL